MKANCELVGASVTESTFEGKTYRKLHCYVVMDHGPVIASKGSQALDLTVKGEEIPAYKDKVFELVGSTVSVIYDKSGTAYKLYDIEEAK